MNRCECISSNQPEKRQIVPPVILVPPFKDEGAVAIDACIAVAVQQLWDAGIWTLGSCCGHGEVNPSVVLAHPSDGDKALEILSRDERRWQALAWVLEPVSNTLETEIAELERLLNAALEASSIAEAGRLEALRYKALADEAANSLRDHDSFYEIEFIPRWDESDCNDALLERSKAGDEWLARYDALAQQAGGSDE